ncbi:MAG: response regulator [Gemmatimonadota bacterium]
MHDPASLRVLIVDDDPTMGALIREVIRSQGIPAPIIVSSGSEALSNTAEIDVILLDHQLPDTTGLEILGALRNRPGRPSVILITGNGDETLAATALRLGADDYLIKDQSLPKLLPQVLERVRRTRALRAALAAAEQDLVNAERMAAIGDLMVTLHHEINNPLMSASAEIELLIEAARDEGSRQSLESVRGSIGRIRDVLKRVGDLEQARTANYVGETGMINLDTEPNTRAVSRGNIVVWTFDKDLGRVIALLLKHAGFTLRIATDILTLVRESNTLGVSAVIIGSPDAPGSRPLGGFSPPRDRMYALIALVQGDGTREREAGADHIVVLPFDPGSFTEEVLRAIELSMG